MELMKETPNKPWRKGTRLQVKEGWYEAFQDCEVLGPPIINPATGQSWTPVLWLNEEDPEFVKTAGLELRPKRKHAGHV